MIDERDYAQALRLNNKGLLGMIEPLFGFARKGLAELVKRLESVQEGHPVLSAIRQQSPEISSQTGHALFGLAHLEENLPRSRCVPSCRASDEGRVGGSPRCGNAYKAAHTWTRCISMRQAFRPSWTEPHEMVSVPFRR